MEALVDLRSDTVTRPSERMRRAMAESIVGDDVFQEDPTVRLLESTAAETFGREAALFVPSGSMGNLIAILCHTERGEEVICESRAHVYRHEMAALSALAGVMPRAIESEDGILSWKEIADAIQPELDLDSWTGLITLENTHALAGGTVVPPERAEAICEGAHAHGIPVHLDGARVFNAAVALGRPVAEITRAFDSVTFCLSKGLGAPVGSVLVGSRDFIGRARRFRKMLGGGMRQAGVLAAAGLVALQDSPGRLHVDHENARLLAEGIAFTPGIAIAPGKVVTNIVLFDVAGTGLDAYSFFGRLVDHGVLALPVGKTSIRMVTHCDVGRAGIETAMRAVRSAATG
jgi:threonine aldolase